MMAQKWSLGFAPAQRPCFRLAYHRVTGTLRCRGNRFFVSTGSGIARELRGW
jgi:hypothetical protein